MQRRMATVATDNTIAKPHASTQAHMHMHTRIYTHMYKSHIKMGGDIQTSTPLALMKIVWIVCNACMNWSALCRNDETVKESADTTHTKTATRHLTSSTHHRTTNTQQLKPNI